MSGPIGHLEDVAAHYARPSLISMDAGNQQATGRPVSAQRRLGLPRKPGRLTPDRAAGGFVPPGCGQQFRDTSWRFLREASVAWILTATVRWTIWLRLETVS